MMEEKRLTEKEKYLSSILKAITAFCSLAGIFLSSLSLNGALGKGSRIFMFFTIQSNILVCIVALIGLILILKDIVIPKFWYVIKFVSTVSITLTGGVFCFVLAPTMKGNAFSVANIFTHIVVPLSFIIDFFVACNKIEIKKSNLVFVTIPPLLYLIFATIGFFSNWEFADNTNYPYFFLNWNSNLGAFGFSTSFPFIGTFWWIVALLILILLVGFIYLKIIDLIKYIKNRTKTN